MPGHRYRNTCDEELYDSPADYSMTVPYDETSSDLSRAIMIMEEGGSIWDLMSLFDDDLILSLGYEAFELMVAGYTPSDLFYADYPVEEILYAGYSVDELIACGFEAELFRAEGARISCLCDMGFSPEDLSIIGFSDEEIQEAMDGDE